MMSGQPQKGIMRRPRLRLIKVRHNRLPYKVANNEIVSDLVPLKNNAFLQHSATTACSAGPEDGTVRFSTLVERK